MLRKPLFWVALVAVSLGGAAFAARYFPAAYPIVSLDLRMDRAEALSRAHEIAARLHLPPEGYREVASFGNDQFVQNFVELEGGGTEALRDMIARGLYHPYTWTVRHFKPGETRESRISFTPEGTPYGFFEKVPEDAPGAALDEDAARVLAERAAATDWQAGLGVYQLVEKSHEARKSGRVDHTFTYERTDVRIGEGRYRLRLVVSGDRLTTLSYFVKVPEAFSRRYENMRSANDLISMLDGSALVIFYFIGGCGFGLFFLLRKRWVQWRAPVLWGLGIALLQLLAGINEWPLSWMGYDTALSADTFTLQRIAQLAFLFLLYAVVFSLSFMAAESLSRLAFPRHIQQWKLWARGVAESRAVLGRTAGGYLLVGVFFAYDVFLYFVATRRLGWWTPSDALVQPDILSTYLPWLSPIANSAQAGFWEESLFRAVPIAGAALIGNRLGGRKWWIAGAFVLQSLIFGGGHAGYMNQPAFARPVELIIPSLAFGALYLCLGLLPGIVLHFAFDVVWMSLPLFVSSAPGVWIDRVFVILATLVPLWIVLGARLRARQWTEVPESLRNGAWRPVETAPRPAAVDEVVRPTGSSAVMRWIIPVAGVAGLALWFFAGAFMADAPPLSTDRKAAEEQARRALDQRGIRLSPPWRTLAAVDAQPGATDRFVWQKLGEQTYRALMGSYLTPPCWMVRFARFEGDVAERAEEYRVFLDGAHGVFRIRHILAEAAPGKTLPESDARLVAQEALKQRFLIDQSLVKEISAVSSKLKARTDWVFTFLDPRGQDVSPGEKRIAVQIAGDQAVDAYRYIHTPEEWDRMDRERQVIPGIITLSCIALIALVALAGAVSAIAFWSRRQFAVSAFLVMLAFLLGIRIVVAVNSLPMFESQFSTAQPYQAQLVMILLAGLLAAVVTAAAAALITGFGVRWFARALQGNPFTRRQPVEALHSASLGCLAAGFASLASRLGPSLMPVWGNYDALGARLPLVASALQPVGRYLLELSILLLIIAAADRFTRGWTKRRLPIAALLFLMGFAFAGAAPVAAVSDWLIAGFLTGGILLISYVFVLRFSPAGLPYAVGAFEIVTVLKAGVLAGFPGALPGAIVASLLIAAAAAAGAKYLRSSLCAGGTPNNA